MRIESASNLALTIAACSSFCGQTLVVKSAHESEQGVWSFLFLGDGGRDYLGIGVMPAFSQGPFVESRPPEMMKTHLFE